jgi:hypothetical protein
VKPGAAKNFLPVQGTNLANTRCRLDWTRADDDQIGGRGGLRPKNKRHGKGIAQRSQRGERRVCWCTCVASMVSLKSRQSAIC